MGKVGRALFLFFAAMLVVSTVGLVYALESALLVESPARGGSLTEGIVGSPRFINPILALSDADRDLTALVYSGLLRATPEGGYVPDLASEYSVSEDGKIYTATLREGAVFHDGAPVTAEDIVFTVQKTQTPALKSPERANWDGVAVEAADERTVRFTLRSPYAPFVGNLALGILPKHLWEEVSDEAFPWSELNTRPVGSGPFKVRALSQTAGGIPSSYTLERFSRYALGEPFLSILTLNFYPSESELINALQSGEIESASGISPANLPDAKTAVSPLSRVFGIFFNQNNSEVLRDKDVRAALSMAIDRDKLVKDILRGYGTPLDLPVPPSLSPKNSRILKNTSSGVDDAAASARAYLESRGWKANESGVLQKKTGSGKSAKIIALSLDLATANVPELRAAAEFARSSWEKMGAGVEIKIYEPGDLSQNIIRPRKYEALLFGEVVGRELDLFAFWHSSQRNDPGLNIAMYANTAADKALEGLRATANGTERDNLYAAFEREIQKDIPAVFLYAPDFVYTVPDSLYGLSLGFVESPSDRFLSVARWHREVDFVWPIFINK